MNATGCGGCIARRLSRIASGFSMSGASGRRLPLSSKYSGPACPIGCSPMSCGWAGRRMARGYQPRSLLVIMSSNCIGVFPRSWLVRSSRFGSGMLTPRILNGSPDSLTIRFWLSIVRSSNSLMLPATLPVMPAPSPSAAMLVPAVARIIDRRDMLIVGRSLARSNARRLALLFVDSPVCCLLSLLSFIVASSGLSLAVPRSLRRHSILQYRLY